MLAEACSQRMRSFNCVIFICTLSFFLIYTLTGHFISCTLLVLGWTHFCLQNCLYSSQHIFKKVLEKFLWDFGPHWNEGITQHHGLDADLLGDTWCNSLISQHAKGALLYWHVETVEVIWVQKTRFDVKKTIWDDLNIMTWFVNLLEGTIIVVT